MASPGNDAGHASPQARALEATLWLLAAACLGTILCVAFQAARAQRASQSLAAQADKTSPSPVNLAANTGQIVGQMRIPALHLSVPIASGIESGSLLSGVGHVDGSALPGGLGTVVLAGHRDTYLRPLEHIAKGMQILLATPTGTYRYSVDRWEIVLPEQVDSIETRDRPELALVTCYPFHFVGAAPRRFVVHAHLLSLIPDPAQP